MKESVINKLKQIVEQYRSIAKQLSDEGTQKNNTLMIKLSARNLIGIDAFLLFDVLWVDKGLFLMNCGWPGGCFDVLCAVRG